MTDGDSAADKKSGGTAVADRSVRCGGGGGALGHPAVYLTIGPEDETVCPYCSRRFVLRGGRADAPAGARADASAGAR